MMHLVSPLPKPRSPAEEPTVAGQFGNGDDRASLPLTVIERRPGWQLLDLRELWRQRELLFFLIWRDIKVRYQHTLLGTAWAVLQPLGTMLVLTMALGRLAAAPTDTISYPLFVLTGLLPWTFFANALGTASQSIVQNPSLIAKVYFPRLFLPMAAVGGHLVDFAVTLALLVLALGCAGYVTGIGILRIVPILGMLLAATLGTGAWLAALNVAYRDVRYALPFVLQLWLFATPAVYVPAERLTASARYWLCCNPAQGLVANFRRALLDQPLDMRTLAISGIASGLLLLGGCHCFRQVERRFADAL
jgi:homopolymeric O-antigen transport system permease protein